MNKAESTKKRILAVSIKLFAKSGFDGTGIDDIAKKAGIPKSLIYYHFRNKEEILREIVLVLSNKTTNYLIRRYPDMRVLRRAAKRPAALCNAHRDYIDKNIDAIRIILAESLKSGRKHLFLLDCIDSLGNILQTENKQIKHGKKDRKMALSLFFTGFIPIALFTILHKQWSKHYKLPVKQAVRHFVHA